MLLQFSKLKMILFFICFVLLPFFCFGQSTVSKNAPNDPTEHLLTLNSLLKLNFYVSASDGKMSRIDTVSDSGSSWNGSGLGTPMATFTGTSNAGQLGTFTPGFSGDVKLIGSGSGPIQTYEWTAKEIFRLVA